MSEISEDDWTIENETKFLYKSEFDEKWLKIRIEGMKATFAELKNTEIHENKQGNIGG
ncbi:MAG: hypothetical protein PHY90_12465 [Desulfitobacteriaceae bacterium]|nr:hypothetical protein [Desulfitobacteriaceae bacterium]